MKFFLCYLSLFLVSFSAVFSRVSFFPFQNTSLPFEDRVKDIVDRLTLQELVEQMSYGGASNNGPAPGIDSLGIKPYQWGTECLSGDVSAGNATSFPMSIGMAASFNYKLVYQVANATSCEVRAKNTDAVSQNSYAFHTGLSCWSPVLNIMRDPRWGRNQETYGEDPYLSGYLGAAFVTGLQGDDPKFIRANAGCKHFDVHGGPEDTPVSRMSFNANVSMKDWHMTFLPQFKACVKAGSRSLMCSYNRINGVPACANKYLLTDVLRTGWGFTGYVVSDQGALENIVTEHHYAPDFVTAAADVANAGTCLEDGNGHDKNKNVFQNLGDAYDQGLVKMDTLKDAVSRLFFVRMQLGEFDLDTNPYLNIPLSIIQSEAHIQLSLQAAMETIVLLKNDEDKGLPMDNVKKACLVGPFIDNPRALFGDYSPTLMSDYVVTPLAALKQNTKIGYESLNAAVGCNDGPACNDYDSADVRAACADVDLIIVTAGISSYLEHEGHDISDIYLPGRQLNVLTDAEEASADAPIVLILFNANPLDIGYAKYNPRITAIIEAYYPAQTGGEAIANVLTGKYNPAGRLPNTWPASLDQVPGMVNYTMSERTYRYFTQEPLYPFGYGLSYTTFSYSNLVVSSNVVTMDTSISVSVTVTNKGKMDGDEVTQVYVRWDSSVTDAPIRQLVAVSRNYLKQGESNQLSFTIAEEQLQLWNEDKSWYTPSGTYTVSVGGQQPDQVTTVPSNILHGQFTI